jgi:hypothetical protein
MLLWVSYSFCFSQDSNKTLKGQHTIYTEFFGNAGLWYSVGYDYTLKLKEKHKLSFNCGFQYFPITNYFPDFPPAGSYPKLILYGSQITISPQINYLYGKNHHLDLGIGITYDAYINHKDRKIKEGLGFMMPFRIGYRYQREKGGFFFKIAYTPIYLISIDFFDIKFIPLFAGIAFGYTFK